MLEMAIQWQPCLLGYVSCRHSLRRQKSALVLDGYTALLMVIQGIQPQLGSW